jgi:uncharacterized membrane protein YqhA
VEDLHDVKVRLSSIIVLVMMVGFLERILQWQDPAGTLRHAIAVTLISGTLIAFSRFGEH